MSRLIKKKDVLNIHTAITRGFFQQVRYLIELGSDVNGRDENGRTPLMLCAFIEEEEWGVGLGRLLVEKDAHIGLRDKKGLNSLHYAYIYQRIELIRVYLNAIDYDLNQGDKLGNTALFYAATVGNLDISRLMILALRKYELTVDKPNKQGVTPLIQAWKTGHIACARMLVTEGNANEDARDNIELKTAKEWEQLFMNKFDRLVLTPQLSSTSLSKFSGNNRIQNNGRRTSIPRVTSAPLLSRRKNQRSVTFTREGCIPEELPLDKKDMTNMIIRSASMSDLRNRPEVVFKTTALDCFLKQNRDYRHMARRSTGNYSEGWRKDVKILYGEIEYQCTSSFRKQAILPPRPPPSDHSGEGTSEATGSDGPLSDRGSSSSKRIRKISDPMAPAAFKGRRGSVASNASAKFSIFQSGKARKASSMSLLSNMSGSTDTIAKSTSKSRRGSAIKTDEDDSIRPASRASNRVPVVKETPAAGHHVNEGPADEDPNYLAPSRAMDD